MKKNWSIATQNLDLQQRISQKLGISTITSQVLINRGIKDEEEAESFLYPSLSDLPSPLQMKDMDKAVFRLEEAILGILSILNSH